MIVYVLCVGEANEGQSPIGVYGSKARAVRAAEEQPSEIGPWSEEQPTDREVRRWEAGRMVMTVRRFAVDFRK